MNETDKTIEGREGRSSDPSLGYRNWRAPNEVERDPALVHSRRAVAASVDEESLTGKTLLATCGFLLAILMVGFVAGYAMRGNAYAGNTTPALMSSAMVTVPAPQGMSSRVGRERLVASLGSQAPDELVSLNARADGMMTAFVRLHDTGLNKDDRLSFVDIAPNGTVSELFRHDAAGIDRLDISRLDDGRFVSAMQADRDISLTGLTATGEAEWTRSLSVAPGHLADISVVTTDRGTAFVGPAEQADRINALYLDMNGNLLWHRSFAADAARPDAILAANPDGSVMLAYRTDAAGEGASHALKRIDENGQDVWTTPFEIDQSGRLSGLVSNGFGGAYLLTTGAYPSLTHVAPSGSVAWDVLLPEAKLFSDINLMSGSDGDAVVAISYDLGVERVDMWIEKRGRDGIVTGEASMSLPGLSTVDAISESGNGKFLVAGSLLPARFEDTDIYVKAFEFRSVVPPARVSERPVVSEAPSITTAPQSAPALASVETMPDPRQNDPQPIIEAEVATPRTLADDLAPAIVDMQQAPVIEAAAEPGNAEVPAISTVEIVRAQCRFTCFEADNTMAVFPMWRGVAATQGEFDSGLKVQHDGTCRSAGGVANLSMPPECQGY